MARGVETGPRVTAEGTEGLRPATDPQGIVSFS